MGLCSLKSDRDRAKNVKLKLPFFKILHFTLFALSQSILGLHRSNLPFWNSQSHIYNILLFGKYAMNYMTEIEEDTWELFFGSVSSMTPYNDPKIKGNLQFCN